MIIAKKDEVPMNTVNKQIYVARRKALGRKIGKGGVAFIIGGALCTRNDDVHYPFRQDSNMLYLTGFNEPDTLLVIIGGAASCSFFFCAPKDPVAEMWNGKRFGPDEAKQQFGFDVTVNSQSIDVITMVVVFLSHCTQIFATKDLESRPTIIPLREIIAAHTKSSPEVRMCELDPILDEYRLTKDCHELELMQKACGISAQAHRDILQLVRPGMNERELEAEITYRFRKAGSDPLHAYPPIVASGKNACTLHYTENSAVVKNGDLVLIDAGCEYNGYASDITRTFPANGTFSAAQREIYALVLAAQKASIEQACVGNTLHAVHEAGVEVITQGLITLGLLTGKAKRAIETKAYRRFYPHGSSHWLGLDVHDAGDYSRDKDGNSKRVLVTGMVITVEPGIYIPEAPDIPEKYWNIGVRIEDDVLINHEGPRILSAGAPKEIDEIEAIMHAEFDTVPFFT